MTQRQRVESGFARNATTMMVGSVLAQALPVLLSPVLTRVFSPAEYGVFAVYVAVVTLLGVLATCRLELAIVLPPEDEEAAAIAVAALVSATAVTLVTAVGLVFAGRGLAAAWPIAGYGPWLWLVPPSVLAVAAYQVGSCWNNRHAGYRVMAAGAAILQGGGALAGLALGLARIVPVGLEGGRLLAQGVAGAWLLGRARPSPVRLLLAVRAVDVRAAIARYRQFPLFNVPYSLVGSFSREVPVFLLTAVGMTASGGAYGLARSVVLAPVTVLSASLSQVFFKEAVDLIHTERLANLAGNVMLAIAMVFTVPFVMLGIFGPELFAAVFGDEWRKAGAFAAILAPVAYLFLYSSWPERLFEVAGAQHVALGVQLLGDLLSILAALAVLRMTGADLPTIGAFAAVSCAYHVVYLATAFRVARIPAAILLRPLQMAITLALTSAMLFSLIRLNLQPRTAIVIALLVSLGGAGWGALRVFRQRLAWFS